MQQSLLDTVLASESVEVDAISPTDAWRPWGRRKRLKRELRRLTDEDQSPALPDHLQD